MELLGILLPIVIDLFNRKIADSDLRFWVSVFICALVGTGLNFLETQFVFASAKLAFDSLSSSILVVFGLAQLSYKGLWENSKVRNVLGMNGQNN